MLRRHEEHLHRTRALFAHPALAPVTPGQRRALLGLRFAFLALAFGAAGALFGRSLSLIA